MTVAPPRPSGPPLNALRAFESAARLGGFTAAASELCVTPGAVAQHVKSLEDWAGARLFERRAQGVQLTPLGAGVIAEFSAAFDRLGGAVQALRAQAAPNHIHIAALPSIAQLWLSPRLPAIRHADSGVTISITAMETPPNLQRELFDLSIFFERATKEPGSYTLCSDVIFPVCSPVVARRLADPTDLAGETCLHDANWVEDWTLWMNRAVPDAAVDVSGPVYSLYSLAVEEALNDGGVLIGHEPLVAMHLASGALVAPFADRVALEHALMLQLAKPAVNHSALTRVINMLVADQTP